jgi:hypothetical protein
MKYNRLSIYEPQWEEMNIVTKCSWSGDRIPLGGEICRTLPELPWGPPSHLNNGYLIFPGGKAAGTWRWPPTPSSAEVKERVELYLYSTSGPSWPVTRWTLHLPCQRIANDMRPSSVCLDFWRMSASAISGDMKCQFEKLMERTVSKSEK